MKALVLALLPTVALAAPPPTARKISALLIPMDQAAEGSCVKLETYLNESLEQFAGFTVRKPEELFGMPANDEAQAAFQRGTKGLTESIAAYDARDYEDAERKLRATLKELQGAVGAMSSCAELCEATALYAAVLYIRGDIEEAKLNLIDLMALSPTFELSTKRYNRDFIALRAQVATGRSAALRGSVTVKSRPMGARVYLDGEFQGYTPDDVETSAELTPTSNYKKYDSQVDKVASEIVKPAPSPAASSMGKALSIERGLLGTVKDLGPNGTELVVGFFDLRDGKKLASRRLVLQGDEYGQEKAEMTRLVNYLVNNGLGLGEKKVKSSDPLENRHGMEEWNAEGGTSGEDRQTKDTSKRKKSGDPLDSVNGTEDW
jgi:hypothetical protein